MTWTPGIRGSNFGSPLQIWNRAADITTRDARSQEDNMGFRPVLNPRRPAVKTAP